MVAVRQAEGQKQRSPSHGPERPGQDPQSGTHAPDRAVATDPTRNACLLGGGLCRERGRGEVSNRDKSQPWPGLL